MHRLVPLLLLCCVAASGPPPLPEAPKQYKTATGLTQGAGAQALIAETEVAQAHYFTFGWCYPAAEMPTIAEFQIYSATIPDTRFMSLYGSTPAKQFSALIKTNAVAEYFSVKAVGTNGLVSEWATKGPCVE